MSRSQFFNRPLVDALDEGEHHGTADAGTLVWGIVGIAALLEALVLFVFGLWLRHRYVNQVRSYDSRSDYLEDDGSNRVRIPRLGDGQALQNITYQSF